MPTPGRPGSSAVCGALAALILTAGCAVSGMGAESSSALVILDDGPAAETSDAATPEEPPADAAVLVVGAESHVAQLADLYEVHWYRFEARQGQDYRIVVGGRSGRAAGDVSVELSLHDSTGAPIATEADPYSLRTHWLFLRGAEERTYYVRVVGASYDPTGEYEIAVGRIADEHGDVPSAGTEIDLADGAGYVGAIDYGGDRDWFVFDAQAGALFKIAIDSGPDKPGGASYRLYMLSADQEDAGSSGDEFELTGLGPWGTSVPFWRVETGPRRIEETGRYAVVVEEDSRGYELPVSYTIKFEFLDDDHSNVPLGATLLQPGEERTASLNYTYDEDWFYVDMVQGERYVVDAYALEEDRAFPEVALYNEGSKVSYRDSYDLARDELIAPGIGRLAWQARYSGPHLVKVSNRRSESEEHYPTEYAIAVSRRPADDHSDAPDGATFIRSGDWTEAELDALTDTDWFQFLVTAGTVYHVELEVLEEDSGNYIPAEDQYGWRDVQAFFVADGWKDDARHSLASADNGIVYVMLSASRPRIISYRFRLVANEEVDYGDDRATASPINDAETVRGSVTDKDSDWFAFEAVPELIYSIGSGQSAYGLFNIAVFDESGEVPSLSSTLSYYGGLWASLGSGLWTVPSPGTYWIRISGKWAAPFAYQLGYTVTEIVEDDYGDSPDEAAAVTFDPEALPARAAELVEKRSRRGIEQGIQQALVEGYVGYFGDSDWFALQLERGVKYRIRPYDQAASYDPPDWDVDATVSLWDGDTLLDSWRKWDDSIDYVPTATGTYHVQVTRGRESPFLERFAYGFEISILAADDVADLRTGATPVSAGDVIAGTLELRNDVDWFSVQATEGQTWLIRSPDERWGCMQVYGPAGSDALQLDCWEGHLAWTAPVSGEYGIRLSHRINLNQTYRAPSEYELTFGIAEPDDHGNDLARASVLVPGEAQLGVIDYLDDRDVFRLDVEAGEFWAVNATVSHHRTRFDAQFFEDADGVQDRTAAQSSGQAHFLTAPVAGVWFISVGSAESIGDYSLTVNRLDVQDDYGNSRQHAHVVPTPESPDPSCESEPSGPGCPGSTIIEGSIDYGADSDYFRVALVEGIAYEFSVDSAAEYPPGLAVLTQSGCARLEQGVWEAPLTDDYWVRVDNLRRHAVLESYTLEISRLDNYVDPWDLAVLLEPGQVYEGDGSAGGGRYRVRLDHPFYVIEVDGESGGASDASPDSYSSVFAQDGSREITELPFDPPVVFDFIVRAWGPYTVVVREYEESDADLDWIHQSGTPAGPPGYCSPEQ